MKKQIAAAVLSGMLVLGSVVPAFAQTTGAVEIQPGEKSFVGTNITFPIVKIDGKDRPNLIGSTGTYTMTDFSGTGEGWTLQISASSFANAEAKEIPLTGLEITVDALTPVNDSGAAPASLLTLPTDLSAPRNIAGALAGQGMGQYTFTPSFTLDVPATVYAGTYQSTITLSINSAPTE